MQDQCKLQDELSSSICLNSLKFQGNTFQKCVIKYGKDDDKKLVLSRTESAVDR